MSSTNALLINILNELKTLNEIVAEQNDALDSLDSALQSFSDDIVVVELDDE